MIALSFELRYLRLAGIEPIELLNLRFSEDRFDTFPDGGGVVRLPKRYFKKAGVPEKFLMVPGEYRVSTAPSLSISAPFADLEKAKP